MIGYGWLFTAVLVASGLSVVAGNMYGYNRGVRDQEAKYNAAEVKALNALIVANKELIAESNYASQSMREHLAAKLKADEKITKDLQNVLRKTEDLRRTVCDFDADSMQLLREARDRAADSATSGVRRTLPTTRLPQ